MTPFTANLKHFYQRRGLCVFYLFLLFWVLGPLRSDFHHISIELGRGWFLLPMILMYVIGIFVGIVVVDVWRKPLTFCLPGHHTVTFRLLCGMSGLWGFLSLLMLRWYPATASRHVAVFAVVFLSLNIMAYWLGVSAMGPIKQARWMGFIPIVFIYSSFMGLPAAVERLMLDPWGMVLLSVGSWAVTAWIVNQVYNRQVVRDVWQRAEFMVKGMVKGQHNDKDSHLADVLHQWFCQKMAHQSGGISGQFWAVWYLTVGRFAVRWKIFVGTSLLLVLVMGYVNFDTCFFLFVFMGTIFFPMMEKDYSFIKTTGRMQRFKGLIMGGGIMQGLVIVILLGYVLLSHALSLCIPDVTIQGQSYSFSVLYWPRLMLSILLMPALLGLGSLFQLYAGLHFRVSMIGMCFLAVCLHIFMISADSTHFGLGLYILLAVCCWGVFLACTHWHCFKQDH